MININLVKTVAENEYLPGLMSNTANHNYALDLVRSLVSIIDDAVLIETIAASALPEDYQGNTLDEISGMCEWALKNNKAESKSKKDSFFDSLTSYLNKAGIELIHSEEDIGCFKVPNENGGFDTFPIKSRRGKLLIRKIIYDEFGGSIGGNDLSDLIGSLEAIAIFDGPQETFHLRLAKIDKEIILDLGNPERSVVKCNADGWEIIPSGMVDAIFRRREGYKSLSKAKRNGCLRKLRELLGITDDQIWYCIIAFIINALRPDGPYCCLILDGEQGSGKSFLSAAIKRIIDPNLLDKMRFPKSERDLMIQAKQYHLLVFDNASGMKQHMSDALCVLATGGGFATRSLRTDEDLMTFVVCRPFIINGIGGFAYNPDLLERGIHVSLPTMNPESRKTEQELNEAFEDILPEVLGVFMGGIVQALRNLESTLTPKGLRMADAARWIAAAEPAFDVPPGSLVEALRRSQGDIMKRAALEETLGQGLIQVLNTCGGKFEGSTAELLSELDNNNFNKLKDPFFPSNPSQLSNKLGRLQPALRLAGIIITKLPRSNKSSLWRIEFDETEDYSDTSKSDKPKF